MEFAVFLTGFTQRCCALTCFGIELCTRDLYRVILRQLVGGYRAVLILVLKKKHELY